MSEINYKQLFEKYLNDFNKQDIEGIKKALHENCEVEFGGQIATKGRENMLPSYVADFKIPAVVKSIGEIKETKKDDNVHITVTLHAVDKKKKMDVVYIYNKEGIQIKHIITNLQDTE
eukprot:gene7436-11759_t